MAPYTNSLILNHSVYVPMGDNASYNQGALEVYQEAMPGYNIVPVYNNDWSIGWENTDALHCRTRGVMDFNMLFVDHREVLHGEQEWRASYPVVSKFIAYSGEPLKSDSLLVYYSINGGEYQVAHMTATGNPDEYVGNITGFQGGDEIDYYVFGADESNHRYTQPVFAELDPHHFTVGEHQVLGELVITPDTLWLNDYQEQTFSIINETTEDVVINYFDGREGALMVGTDEELPYTLTPGSSIDFHVRYVILPIPPGKDYILSEIIIYTSIGELTEVVMFDEVLDVTEVSAETKLYPNPTTGNFTVEGANVAKVEVYNLVGQKIYAGQGAVINIDANEWNKGIYLVSITMVNGAVETKKLVVK